MFLALKELKYSKMKFALIITVIVLISYLVYFLTSLANGLATSYTDAINKWEAQNIVLTTDANDNIMMSYMVQEDFESIETNGEKAKVGFFPAVINNPNAEDVLESRLDVYFIGVTEDSFLIPNEVEDVELKDNQVIVDDELQKEGYEIGDCFGVTGNEQEYEIVAFASNITYQTAPVIYMNMKTWQQYRYGETNTPNLFSGVIVRGEVNSASENLVSYFVDRCER